jgi:hypothetical protein
VGGDVFQRRKSANVGHWSAFLTGREAPLPPDKSITIRHAGGCQQKSSLTYIIPK